MTNTGHWIYILYFRSWRATQINEFKYLSWHMNHKKKEECLQESKFPVWAVSVSVSVSVSAKHKFRVYPWFSTHFTVPCQNNPNLSTSLIIHSSMVTPCQLILLHIMHQYQNFTLHRACRAHSVLDSNWHTVCTVNHSLKVQVRMHTIHSTGPLITFSNRLKVSFTLNHTHHFFKMYCG